MTARNFPSLEGKTVVVTGGASGIGEAIVRKFVGEGARVAFIDINEEAGQKRLLRSAGLTARSSSRPTCATSPDSTPSLVASPPLWVRSASWSTTPVTTSDIQSRT